MQTMINIFYVAIYYTLLLLAITCIPIADGSTIAISNPGFESNSVTGDYLSGCPTSWTCTASSTIVGTCTYAGTTSK